jgi:hypothetical protein
MYAFGASSTKACLACDFRAAVSKNNNRANAREGGLELRFGDARQPAIANMQVCKRLCRRNRIGLIIKRTANAL